MRLSIVIFCTLVIVHQSVSGQVYRVSNLVPPDSLSSRQYYTSCKIGRGIINSAHDAREYRGCSKILGDLQITVQDTRAREELFKSLQDVEIITGYLQVKRSPVLSSLHFLPRLKAIEGHSLAHGNYSLLVYENSELRSLFIRDSGLQLERGRGYFHSNSKLCSFEIDQVKRNAKEANWSGEDVNPFSNGNKIKCHEFQFNVQIMDLNSNGENISTFVTWNKLNDESLNSCRLYSLYYRKVSGTSEPVSWFMVNVTEVYVEMSAILHCLQRGAQYSLYIETQTYDPDSKAVSEVITFTPGTVNGIIAHKSTATLHTVTTSRVDPIDLIRSNYIKSSFRQTDTVH